MWSNADIVGPESDVRIYSNLTSICRQTAVSLFTGEISDGPKVDHVCSLRQTPRVSSHIHLYLLFYVVHVHLTNMPKARKQKIRKEKQYSEESIIKALNAVEDGMPLRRAANMFGVPKSTLHAIRSNKCSVKSVKGPSTILSENEEKRICDWILECSARGFPVSKEQLFDTVQKFIADSKRDVPFKHGRPGRHWFDGFKRRHPELSIRLAQNLTLKRASVTEEALRQWFQEVKNYLEKQDLLTIDASRIFNCDETAFFFCLKANQVIVKRGLRSVYTVVNGNERQNVTVLFMVRGDGIVIPPMVMYHYERMPYTVSQSVPKHWFSGISAKGWMTSEAFYEYITNCFYPWLKNNNVEFPVILYVDGHVSHITYPLCQFCKAHKIELIALYPNSTHILQPLDIAVFHPLKCAYKKALEKWRLANHLQRVKNENFCSILEKAMQNVNSLSIVPEGFRAAGLMPFNPDAINYMILNHTYKKNEKQQDNQPNITNTNDNINANLLHDFETALPVNVLDHFKNAETSGNWKDIEEQYDGLFQFWMKLKAAFSGNCTGTTQNQSLHVIEDPLLDIVNVHEVHTTDKLSALELGNVQIECCNVHDISNELHVTEIHTNSILQGTTQTQSLTRDSEMHVVEDPLLGIVNMHEVHTTDKLSALELGNVQIEYCNVHDTSNELNVTEIHTNSILQGTTQNQSLTRDSEMHVVEDPLLGIVNMHEVHTTDKLSALELGNVQREYCNVHDTSNELNVTEIHTNSILQGTTQNQSLTRDSEMHVVEDPLLSIVNMHEVHTTDKLSALELGNVQIECCNVHDTSNELHVTEIHTNSILKESSNENQLEIFKSPFEKHFVFPDKVRNIKNKKLKENIPSVGTSEEWERYYLQKELCKRLKREQIEDRKKKRKEAQLKKAEEKELKKSMAQVSRRLKQEEVENRKKTKRSSIKKS